MDSIGLFTGISRFLVMVNEFRVLPFILYRDESFWSLGFQCDFRITMEQFCMIGEKCFVGTKIFCSYCAECVEITRDRQPWMQYFPTSQHLLLYCKYHVESSLKRFKINVQIATSHTHLFIADFQY